MTNNKFRFYTNMVALAKHLEEMENWQELTKYEVFEHYEGKEVKTFEFLNLKAEVGNELGETSVIFYDAEETIYEVTSNGFYSTLLGFMENSVQSAYFSIPVKGRIEIRIIFDTGYIDIIAHSDYEIEENEYAYAHLDMDSPEVEDMYKEYYAQPDAYDF